MKTPEDEAFDEIAKKQGAWGGGYQAKRAAAADKLQDGKCKLCVDGCAACDAREQLAQEPPSEWAGIKAILDEYGLQAIDFVADFKAALAQPTQEPVAWVGLTEEETSGFTQHELTLAIYVSKVLQEKNT